MIYDLLVIGNGLSAKLFLFELFNSNEINCQNLTIAQVFSEELAPSCTMRSTATISLNGIEEGISPLGDLLQNSYKSFIEFYDNKKPKGIDQVSQYILASNEKESDKLQRRFSNLVTLDHSMLSKPMSGIVLDSFLVSPSIFLKWIDLHLNYQNIHKFNDFVLSIAKVSETLFVINFKSGLSLYAKNLILCNGAYSKIFENHFSNEIEPRDSKVVAGSFLEKDFDYPSSFYFTFDGHNLIYRKEDQKLILGSSSQQGSYECPDLMELKKIYELFCSNTKLNMGPFETFSFVNGLRLKGKKRTPFYGLQAKTKNIFLINGLYKNGYTYSFYLSKKVISEISSLL